MGVCTVRSIRDYDSILDLLDYDSILDLLDYTDTNIFQDHQFCGKSFGCTNLQQCA